MHGSRGFPPLRARCARWIQLALAFIFGLSVLSGIDQSAIGKSIWLTGVNLSGGELNGDRSRLHFDYTYPTVAEFDYFAKKGLRTFRIPILAQRIQNKAGPDFAALKALIDHVETLHGTIIIDVHQFGRMPAGLVGRDPEATRQFVSFWDEIASKFKNEPDVIFGLMNEPHEQTAAEWLRGANAAIAAIRRSGAHQLILVPGSYWSGAHSWTSSDNAKVMLGVVDPDNHFAFEVHQYLDADNSGSHPEVVAGAGSTRLVRATEWARAKHAKLFLGEFGFAGAPAALAEGEALLKYMRANRDVWMGWTYWAGGPWWGAYMFSVEPQHGEDRPQLRLLMEYE